jgi:multidrug resistance efflux pump
MTEVHCEIDGGRIEQVFIREGDFVTTGQPLAQINRREYEKNLQATKAQLDDTEAKLRLLRKQLAMLDQPPNIEQIQSLQAEVLRLQTLVADYQRQLDLTTLRAPVTGRATTPLIEQKVGQYLKKGDLFATVEQAEAVRVEIQVPEADAPQVRVGIRVKVVPWAYSNETFYGTVKDIAPIANTPPNSLDKAVRVIAELSNRDLRLKSQVTGYAKVKTDPIPVWLVLLRVLIRWFKVQFWYWLP